MLKCNKDIPTTYSCKRQQVLCYHRVWNLFGRYKDFFSLLPLQLSLVETFIFLFSSSWFFLSQFLKFKMNPKLSFHLFFLHQLLRNLSNFAGVLQSEMANSLSHTQYAELSFRREIFERLLVSNQRKWFDYCSRMVVGSGWFSNTFWQDEAQRSLLRCTADGSSRTSTASGPDGPGDYIWKITIRSIRYKFDKSKFPSFNNPDGYLTREKCAKLTKLFIVVGVTAVCDQEFVQPS